MKHPAKVIVAGAGIGGLTAAIALRRAGFEVAVFERTTELREVGAGLLLAANAQKALGKLGLAEAVARLGTPASAGEIHSWRGEALASIPAAELQKKVGAPSAAVPRADLQALLVREVGEGTLRLSVKVKGFEQDESGVRASIADRSGPHCLAPRNPATLATRPGGLWWDQERSFWRGAEGSSRGGEVPGSAAPT